MNLQSQIDALEHLARIDADAKIRDAELEKERDALEQKRAELRGLEEKNAGTNASINEMDKTRNELVQEARQMSVQLERSREKMSRCRTEREVNAAQREMEELRKLFRDREIEIGKLSALIQQAQEEIDARTTQKDGIIAALGSTEASSTTRMNELTVELQDFASRRAEVAKVLPKPLFRKYEQILTRRPSALAHTDDGKCSECHMMLPPMMFQQMRRQQGFDQCPSCNRIIYFRPPAQPAETASEQ